MNATSKKKKRELGNPLSATLTAISDIRDKSDLIAPSPPTDRLDSKTCLVTGANSGLGRAIAMALAERGATLILALRRDLDETVEALVEASGNENISARQVDLSDLRSVDQLIQGLVADQIRIDRLILNAGLMAPKAVETPQGFEQMFAVHYLANQRLMSRLAQTGVLAPSEDGELARIVAVSSEAHRSAPPIDMAQFGVFQPHGMGGSMRQYGHTKLALNLAVQATARALRDDQGKPTVSVFHMCPGPINSNIARKAPAMLRPLIGFMMSRFFPSPQKAAEPAIYLAASPDMQGRSGEYMHLMRFRAPSDASLDPGLAEEVIAFGDSVFSQLAAERASVDAGA